MSVDLITVFNKDFENNSPPESSYVRFFIKFVSLILIVKRGLDEII